MALIEEIKVPLLAVNDTTLTVTELSFAAGAKVKKGDVIMVFETSKTTYDVETAVEGFIQYCCEPGRDYEVNEIVARIFSAAEDAITAIPIMPLAQQDTARAPGHWEGETIFSQEAIGLLQSSGLDRSVFKDRDFVSAGDVLQLLQPEIPASPLNQRSGIPRTGEPRSATSSRDGIHGAGASRPKTVAPTDPAKTILSKLTTAKRREIEFLGDIQSAGLTSTIHSFVETEGIFIHINRSLKYLRDSLLPVIIYEASRLLTDYPQLNAYFTGDGIATYREVNPGFAIDIDKGLKVLKIAGAGEKNLQEIESAILTLSGDYLDDTIRLEDLTDITFTITDLGSEGVAFFKPLINKMNSAILGISAIDTKLQRCALSLTFDHRVTEGKLAARFLRELKLRLESYRAEEDTTRKNIACFKCQKTLAEDLGNTGFVRCVTPAGKEGYICQSCIKGF